MGQTILTAKQLDFLELAQAQASINRRFYLTGGTALSGFYFHHRLSEDIDLFSEQEVSPAIVEPFLKNVSPKLGVNKIIKQQFLGLHTYKLNYQDGDVLKVDFNCYPFLRIEKGVFFKKLEVSSIYDIAVNKIHTISMRARIRDYVDLYFIFRRSPKNTLVYLEKMRIDSQAKFDWPLETKNLIVALTRVKDIKKEEMPKMLVPFDENEMEDFYLNLAKSLKKEIFE